MAKTRTWKVLSVRQPWAWLLVHDYKDIENRKWSTSTRGECLIHAGQTFDQDGYNWVRRRFPKISLPKPSEFERGGIVGSVEILDCVTASTSPWYFGPFGFVVRAGKALPFYKIPGRLKFFEIPAPLRVLVLVEPDRLFVNDDRRADVQVTVRDLAGMALPGLSLVGKVKPKYLGEVSELEETDARGVSCGLWYAGSRKGTGLLIARLEDGTQGQARIELIRPPKPPNDNDNGEEDEDEDEDEDEGEDVKDDNDKSNDNNTSDEHANDGEDDLKDPQTPPNGSTHSGSTGHHTTSHAGPKRDPSPPKPGGNPHLGQGRSADPSSGGKGYGGSSGGNNGGNGGGSGGGDIGGKDLGSVG